MRVSFLVVLLLAALVVPTPGTAGTDEYVYATPGTVAVPGMRTNVALCDDPDEVCLGGVVFPMRGRSAISAAVDDGWGTNAAMLLCVWQSGEGETCDAEAASEGCGTRALLGLPYHPHKGVVYLYTLRVDLDLTVCGATTGRLTVSAF